MNRKPGIHVNHTIQVRGRFVGIEPLLKHSIPEKVINWWKGTQLPRTTLLVEFKDVMLEAGKVYYVLAIEDNQDTYSIEFDPESPAGHCWVEDIPKEDIYLIPDRPLPITIGQKCCDALTNNEENNNE